MVIVSEEVEAVNLRVLRWNDIPEGEGVFVFRVCNSREEIKASHDTPDYCLAYPELKVVSFKLERLLTPDSLQKLTRSALKATRQFRPNTINLLSRQISTDLVKNSDFNLVLRGPWKPTAVLYVEINQMITIDFRDDRFVVFHVDDHIEVSRDEDDDDVKLCYSHVFKNREDDEQGLESRLAEDFVRKCRLPRTCAS